MKKSIMESNLLQELKSEYKDEYLHESNLGKLQGTFLRRFIRLYNVSRVEELFFKV
jgi:hypothetical protein